MKDEEWYVIFNMNCRYEICRMCPKSGLFKGSYEECEKWIEQNEREGMKEKSILEMVGGEKYINPHYNIKTEKMKDEEMAEEWWNNWVVKDWNDLQEGKRLFIQAFLAGLKADRPQWHKVADGDLPKENKLVLMKITGCFVLGWYNGNDWYNDSQCGVTIPSNCVIAWCELPVLPKEIE